MAVLRQIPEEYLVPLADLLVEGGVRSLEITHDYERTTDDVAMLSKRFGWMRRLELEQRGQSNKPSQQLPLAPSSA